MSYKDYQGKDAKELQGVLAEARGELKALAFHHSIGQVKNTTQLTQVRKRIAHILTALNAQR